MPSRYLQEIPAKRGGDCMSHVDFREGRVMASTGAGAKRIAEVAFDTAGRKELVIKVAPIEKLSPLLLKKLVGCQKFRHPTSVT